MRETTDWGRRSRDAAWRLRLISYERGWEPTISGKMKWMQLGTVQFCKQITASETDGWITGATGRSNGRNYKQGDPTPSKEDRGNINKKSLRGMVNSISQNWYQSFLQNADTHVLKKILVCFRAWSSAPSTFADFCILWSHGYLVWILIVCVWKFKFDLWNKSYRNWTYFHVVLF